MKLIPVQVECHSGYKAGEYPTSFYWMNIHYEIKEISDRWYQAQAEPGAPVANYFKVRTASRSKKTCNNEVCQHTFHGGPASGPTFECS